MEQALRPHSELRPWQALGLSLLLHALVVCIVLALGVRVSQSAIQVPHPPLQISLVARHDAVPSVSPPAARPKPRNPLMAAAARQVSHLIASSHPAPVTTAISAPIPTTSAAITTDTPAATATAPTATTTAQAASTFVPASSDAAYLNNPKPEYPAMAKLRRLEGLVMLRVVVSREGLPLSVTVFSSSHFSVLDNAAAAAVSLWRFVPARRGADAVEDTIKVPILFSLRDQG